MKVWIQKEQMRSEDFSPLTLKQLMDYEVSDNKWLVEHLLPQDGVAILSGEAGSFKTWMLLHIVKSVAGGTKVFDTFETQQGKVLMVDEENRIPLLKERLKMLGVQEDLPIHFLVRSGVDFGGDEHSVQKIANFVNDNKIKFITFDSLIRVQKRDENDARAMSEFFDSVKIFQEIGTTVLITHHHRKEYAGQPSSASQTLRGSSDIRAALDSHLAVFRKGSREIQIIQSKCRDAQEINPFTLKIEVENDQFNFRYLGESSVSVKQEAKIKILELLQGSSEISRPELLEKLKGVIGGNALGEALNELEQDKKITVTVKEKGKKFYSLVPESGF